MAKWGEGDPRWIVEEREDAKNVNNWHWTEKNATQWSKSELRNLLEAVVLDDGKIMGNIQSMSKCDGEATANNRKAKLIFFYEWVIECKWEARVAGDSKKYEGTLEIPNLSDENTADDIVVDVAITTSGPNADAVKELWRIEGEKAIRKQCAEYIRKLREEYSKDLILPSKGSAANLNASIKSDAARTSAAAVDKKQFHNTVVTEGAAAPAVELKEGETKWIEIDYTFPNAPPDLVYNAFVQKDMIAAWSRSPVEVESRVGGKFKLYNGMIEGEFTLLEPTTRVEMNWRMKSYPPGHYAHLTLTFNDTGDATVFKLRAEKVPRLQADDTEDGLQRHYLSAIARTFLGNGGRLM